MCDEECSLGSGGSAKLSVTDGPLRIPDDAVTVDLFSMLMRKKKGPDATFSQLACWRLRRHSPMPVYRGYLIHLQPYYGGTRIEIHPTTPDLPILKQYRFFVEPFPEDVALDEAKRRVDTILKA